MYMYEARQAVWQQSTGLLALTLTGPAEEEAGFCFGSAEHSRF